MEPFRPKSTRKTGPESKIQEAVIAKLRSLGWHVEVLAASQYMAGLPDLMATHSRYGIKLIEIKNPAAFSFTPAQRENFPKLVANGAPIWILIGDSEKEISKIFGPSNLFHYMTEVGKLCNTDLEEMLKILSKRPVK